jgi:hypothetical protein
MPLILILEINFGRAEYVSWQNSDCCWQGKWFGTQNTGIQSPGILLMIEFSESEYINDYSQIND